MSQQLFFGKYRGTVVNNLDPLHQGRVQVSVPAVLGDGQLSWALPCVPYAGPGVGFYAIPPRGANIWVEFEGGSPNYPIWSGCFWGAGELPAAAATPDTKLLKTAALTLTLNDLPGGGLTLQAGPPAIPVPITVTMGNQGLQVSTAGANLTVSAQTVELSLGAAKVTLTPASVSINNGALEVT